jgi:hypothetical protein
MWPGLALLACAPVLLVWIGLAHGVWPLLAALAAFVSMFRRPLWYLTRRMLGHKLAPPYGEEGK